MTTSTAWIWTFGYDYLARAWLEGPLRLHEDALVPWISNLGRLDAGLSRDVAGLVRCLDDPAELKAAMGDFEGCVVVPLPGRHVPPYASVYLDASRALWGTVTKRVLSWYDEADLDWVGASSRYPWVRAPDHLGVECAFAAELWAASDDGRPPTTDLGQAFVAGHLPEWVPRYAAEMRDRTTSSYWRGMADFLEGWVHGSALAFPDPTGAHSKDLATDGATRHDAR
ncbi:MAG: molecular chaperone TorD family protein [Actinomycetota bacterium]|jgi:TorA maturation chaperone TorD|nr:molecular chaperone TorD family protein [Actinomycetota bacterium]